MEAKINALKEQMEISLGAAQSQEELAEFWQAYLGKKGTMSTLEYVSI